VSDLERVQMRIAVESDAAVARIRTRDLALAEGFTEIAAVEIATAVSELARNVLVHASSGELELGVRCGPDLGVVAIVRDHGPGIPDIESALRDGYSTVGTLGLGLSSARRLVDELQIVSEPSLGTTVTVTKWQRRAPTSAR
jgi:serine/threonine-protein kinase RsbT